MRRFLVVCGLLAIAACSPAQPPDTSSGVPVVDRQGNVVGTADPEEMENAAEGGPPAEVRSDGQVVGTFGPDGYLPLGGNG